MADKSLGERDYGAGDIIMREGENSTEMFVILEGAVEVTRKAGDREIVLATLNRGDFFGEMSLLESLPRSATVRAVGRTKLLAIRAGELLMKFRRDPTFAFEMLQRMSRRVRHLNEEVVKLLERDRITRQELEKLSLETEFAGSKDQE